LVESPALFRNGECRVPSPAIKQESELLDQAFKRELGEQVLSTSMCRSNRGIQKNGERMPSLR